MIHLLYHHNLLLYFSSHHPRISPHHFIRSFHNLISKCGKNLFYFQQQFLFGALCETIKLHFHGYSHSLTLSHPAPFICMYSCVFAKKNTVAATRFKNSLTHLKKYIERIFNFLTRRLVLQFVVFDTSFYEF
jgi:hypothetical protein